jgi:hypothetical protein
MKFCLLKFDASHCFWKQDTSKPKEEQVQFCKNYDCPHGTIVEEILNGETVALVSCDLTWNPFDNREVTSDEREEMEVL